MHRDYFDTILPPPESYHELSAVLSGPIRIPKLYNGKDKAFCLFGFARHHEKASETFIGDVPSPDMPNGNFNFFDATGKQVGNTIYDPTIRQLANGFVDLRPVSGQFVIRANFGIITQNLFMTSLGS